MAISGVGQSYYQNIIATTKKSTKSLNSTEETGSTQELSEAEKLEAFKKEIWNEINSMPRSSSISWSIQITDRGFKRMMEDEEYKEKILNYLREDAVAGRPPITTSICRIDENGGTGAAYGFGYGEDIYKAHSSDKNSFYSKKAINKSDSTDLTEYYEKQRRERELQKELRDKEYFQHKEMTEYWNKRQSAAVSYDANIMTTAVGNDSLFG